ncbi:hypothetical protein AX15_006540 [Amanita polypyramis BW_CC]|nr:hypothetical protein AX15_006540 [Amanita polypyramis BW_CC]
MPKDLKPTVAVLTPVSKPYYKIPKKGSTKKKGSEQSLLSLEKVGDLNREEYGKSKCSTTDILNPGGSSWLPASSSGVRAMPQLWMATTMTYWLGLLTSPPANCRPSHWNGSRHKSASKRNAGRAPHTLLWGLDLMNHPIRDGDRYTGPYFCDEETSKVKGCPARSSAIKSMVKAARAKSATSRVRNHALPMTIEDMTCIMKWSESLYPQVSLFWPARIVEEQTEVMKHAFMCAFMTTGFTLWTRNFELCELKAGHITDDFTQSPHNLPYFLVDVKNRKGWLRKVNRGWRCEDDSSLESA